jgi:integrase
MARYKTNVPYLTFLGEWATKYLRIWLESRGRVKPDERLWPVTKQAIDAYFHSRALSYADVASFEFRNPYAPHTLRAGCNTHLRNHKADPIYTAFWMGHDVPEQEKVYVSKTHEGWRKTYVLMAEAWVTPPEFRRKELKDIARAWAKTNGLVE